MAGKLVDTMRYFFKKRPVDQKDNYSFISTDFGEIRIFDNRADKPVIISVPDGPNVIEHHEHLIKELSKDYRVICFEYNGLGKSYPNSKFDYSFSHASQLLFNIMDILKIEKAVLSFSCSNGFYAIKAAELFPQRIVHLFLSQTPSLKSMVNWTSGSIPNILQFPFIGQIVNWFSEKKLAKIWYKYALPLDSDNSMFVEKAVHSLENGGCFCLSSLVQGMKKEAYSNLKVLDVPSTIVWGTKDYTHRNTERKSILEHLPNSEIIEFENCGHFPELEDSKRYVELVKQRFP